MALSTITSKGQVTIPIRIREELQLEPGMKLDFVVLGDDCMEVRPKRTTLEDLFGSVSCEGKHLALEDMKTIIEEAATDRYVATISKQDKHHGRHR